MSENLTTSHAIIKALKATADPPIPGGPTKIQIAHEAWLSYEIYFPSKREVLVEWILSSFLRKSKTSDVNAIVTPAYWSLLSSILTSDLNHDQKLDNAQAWLSTLSNRVSFASVILNLLNSLPECFGAGGLEPLEDSLRTSLLILWPIASLRMNLDTLADCFGSTLLLMEALNKSGLQEQQVIMLLCTLIAKSFRQSLGNATNRKKVCTNFLQKQAQAWVSVTSSYMDDTHGQEGVMKSELYLAGIESLFNVDSLKGTTDPYSEILGAITVSCLHLIPRVFDSYLEVLRRYRFAIFGSGSNHSQEQAIQSSMIVAAMQGFASSNKRLRDHVNLDIWRHSLNLLTCLEKWNVVNADENGALKEVSIWATQALTVDTEAHSMERGEIALQMICVLARIDFDVVKPLIPVILSSLLKFQVKTCPSSSKLLLALLEFHSKARTLSIYVLSIVECLSPTSISECKTGPKLYQAVASSALLDLSHLDQLSRSISSFLTPGQTLDTVTIVLDALRISWDELKNELTSNHVMDVDHVQDGIKRRKKRRRTEQLEEVSSIVVINAISFSSVAKIAAAVLPALPVQTLAPSVRDTVLSIVRDTSNTFIAEACSLASETFARDDSSRQMVAASALRLAHALGMSSRLRDITVRSVDGVLLRHIPVLVKDNGVQAELVLESLRYSFDCPGQQSYPKRSEDIKIAIDALLGYLASGEFGNKDGWNGRTSSMLSGDDSQLSKGVVAAWYMITDRWLAYLEEFATLDQMKDFASLCLRAIGNIPPHTNCESNTVTIEGVCYRAIRSAAFWEIANLRTALESIMVERLQRLDDVDISSILRKLQSKDESVLGGSTIVLGTDEMQSVTEIYSMLLLAPNGFISRSHRTLFLRRAIAADISIYLRSLHFRNSPTNGRDGARTTIRRWIKAQSDSLNALETAIDWMEFAYYLQSAQSSADEDNDFFVAATLELLDEIYRDIIRSAIKETKALSRFVSLCGSLPSNFRDATRIGQGSLLHFVDILDLQCLNSKPAGDEAMDALRSLYRIMADLFESPISNLVSQGRSGGELDDITLVRGWRSTLVLGRLLGTRECSDLYRGESILKTLSAKSGAITTIDENSKVVLYLQVLGIYVEEVRSAVGRTRLGRLERLMAAYCFVSEGLVLSEVEAFDGMIRNLHRVLTISDYAYLLSLLNETLSMGPPTLLKLQGIVRLLQVLLSDGPEGTSKMAQECFEKTLQTFLSNEIFWHGDADLCRGVLEFIGSRCSERPSSLKALDIGMAFLILAKILANSPTHSIETHNSILRNISVVINAIMRHRRDLILSTLPHLGMVLRQMILCLRSVRMDLGAKQTRIITDGFPWWISSITHPLGVEDARITARLLTTLQVKTIPSLRSHVSFPQKAESLARPFSKHAPYVLTAYIDAMNDPLCSLPLPVRKELEPGLFALCDMMTEQGRDAVMVSALDAGGKATLKVLWREYEKQRYVGKG